MAKRVERLKMGTRAVDNEAALLAERLRAAADAVGAHIAEGHVRTGPASTIPEVDLDAKAALALITADAHEATSRERERSRADGDAHIGTLARRLLAQAVCRSWCRPLPTIRLPRSHR